MKRKIVICCQNMDNVRINGEIETHSNGTIYGRMTNRKDRITQYAFAFCPWCGEKLPFPYEEVNRFDDTKEGT